MRDTQFLFAVHVRTRTHTKHRHNVYIIYEHITVFIIVYDKINRNSFQFNSNRPYTGSVRKNGPLDLRDFEIIITRQAGILSLSKKIAFSQGDDEHVCLSQNLMCGCSTLCNVYFNPAPLNIWIRSPMHAPIMCIAVGLLRLLG